MDAATITLADFLLARIAEDEAVAKAAVGEAIFQTQTGHWVYEKVRDKFGPIPIVFAAASKGAKTQVANLEAAWESEQRGEHIARHDPARVLAECEAKRRIVEWASDGEGEWHWSTVLGPLAAVYADHPDYRDEWRP